MLYISNNEIIQSVCGVIYRSHPYHKPENIDKIVDKFLNYYRNYDDGGSKNNRFKLLEFKSCDDFYKWLKDFLLDIKEFRQLNISKRLKEKGVDDIDDKRNKGIRFIDRYTIEDEDSAYDDFIDLDACIRNIYNDIINNIEKDSDCFLCKYAKEYGSMEPGDEICKSCSCNPNITYKGVPHPMSIKPKKQWTEEEKEKYKL